MLRGKNFQLAKIEDSFWSAVIFIKTMLNCVREKKHHKCLGLRGNVRVIRSKSE